MLFYIVIIISKYMQVMSSYISICIERESPADPVPESIGYSLRDSCPEDAAEQAGLSLRREQRARDLSLRFLFGIHAVDHSHAGRSHSLLAGILKLQLLYDFQRTLNYNNWINIFFPLIYIQQEILFKFFQFLFDCVCSVWLIFQSALSGRRRP